MFSQNTDMIKKVEKLKKRGRDSIIKIALEKIDETICLNDYIIRVKANKTSVVVSFHIPVVYIPMNSVYYYDFGLDLIEGSSWSGIISNPRDYGTDQDDIPNYSSSEKTQKHIQFVLDAINQSDEIGSINIEDFSFDDSMIIRDQIEYYEITMLSTYQESFYKIDKETGKVYDAGHAHLIPAPDFEEDDDPFEEIN